jgi:1-acyl-sn-glycerol-3-phosphate acyltransferase
MLIILKVFGDTLIPSIPIYPKRNFFIVNPENVSIKFLGNLTQMFGAIPLPSNKKAMKNFLDAIKLKSKSSAITIYPEAHIWPYYTKIRPFKSVSFSYPVELKKPTFCMTNTYQIYKKNKIRIVTYIDGPFLVNTNLPKIEAKKDLKNQIYTCMVQRSKNNNIEFIKYIKK